MWKRAAAKLLSLRSLASSPWSARLPSSGNLSKRRHDVIPLPIATGHERLEPEPEPAVMKSVDKPIVVATPLWSSPRPSGPPSKRLLEKTGYDEYEYVGGDLVDYDYKKAPFGTKEKPTVMRSYYDVQVAGCCGPKEDQHDTQFFWIQNGVITVCPICSQHLTLECVGLGGYPPKEFNYIV